MPYFLSAEKLQPGKEIEITGDEAKHIMLSRRIKSGEHINVQDPDEKRFEAEVVSFNKKSVRVKILKQISAPSESSTRIILFQAFVKEKALENIIQKSTELGISEIDIFQSERAPFSLANEQKKLSRLQKISQEASKQCDRLKTPVIKFLTFEQILKKAADFGCFFILDKSGGQTFAQAAQKNQNAPASIGICVGPEGGLASNELAKLSQIKNAAVVSFGPRVLRADTAAISALTAAQMLFGDMK